MFTNFTGRYCDKTESSIDRAIRLAREQFRLKLRVEKRIRKLHRRMTFTPPIQSPRDPSR